MNVTDGGQLLLPMAALAIGLLFGLERGWHGMQEEEKAHRAGVRSFGLIGLLSGVTGLIVRQLEHVNLGFVFVALAGVVSTVRNGRFKSTLAWIVGGAAPGLRVTAPVLVASLAGLAVPWGFGVGPLDRAGPATEHHAATITIFGNDPNADGSRPGSVR